MADWKEVAMKKLERKREIYYKLNKEEISNEECEIVINDPLRFFGMINYPPKKILIKDLEDAIRSMEANYTDYEWGIINYNKILHIIMSDDYILPVF